MQKYLPLVLIFVFMLAAYLLGLQDYFNLDTLKEHRHALKLLVAEHATMAVFIYIATYILLTAIALPLDAFLCLTAGFLFPQPWCTFYVLIGALTGGILLFLAARTAFGDLLARKAGPRLKKMEHYFQENAIIYLLLLRLIPVFPTWVVNLGSGLCNVPLSKFIWASAAGILPPAYVFSQAGSGLGAILDSAGRPSLTILFTPTFIVELAALIALALLLVALKRYLRTKY